MNPAGFNYCGFCATPMESTEMRAQIAELAAPPGGWPNLTSELVEVRFYLQQGLFDDAYELLSILQKRHPGHPQLSELARRPKAARRVDTGVMALVDSVLAESANLVAKMPRRAAPRFSAPAQGGADRTDVHTVVPPEEEETQARRPKTGSQQSTRRSGSHPTTEGARSARGTRSTGANRTTSAEAAPEAPRREPTRIYRAVEPPPSATRGASRGAAERPASASEPTRSAPRGEASGARPVVQAPAIPAQHNPGARPAEPSRAAASAPARPVSQASSPVPARPVPQPTPPARASRPTTGATEVRAAPKPETRAPAPAVTGRTVISKPPQTGHTVVVDALQAPAPYPEENRASRGTRRRRDEERPAEAAPAEPVAAAEPAAEPAPAAAPKTEQPRRRASFGEHVLNRLR